MSPNDTETPTAEATVAEAEAAAPAPVKKRRAPRKKAQGAPQAELPPGATEVPAPTAAELFGGNAEPPAAAPVAAPVVAEASAAESQAPVAAVNAPAAAVEARAGAIEAPAAAERTPVTAKHVPATAEHAPMIAEQAPTIAEQASTTAGAVSATAAEASPAGEGAPPAEAGEERESRRSRNRRRGRGRGERDPRAEGDVAEGAPAAAAVDVDVDDEDGDADGQPAVAPPPRPAPQDIGELFAEVLSGAFDAEPAEAEAPALPPKRVLAAEPDAPKLHKVLAQAGVGSRRDMEQMIVEGRITVNGEPAHIGQRISFGDRIAVGGKPVRVRIAPPPPRVLAYHKPAGEVVTHDDPQQRPTVFRRLPRLQQGKWQSVGRLDINTEGLLLFTNSGELANHLMHPRFGVEREYAVRSLGSLDEESKARLLEGVEIDGQRCAFKSIDDGGGEGANHWYRCVITEGRNREVRKLFEAAGHAVSRLIRIRYGSVVLPKGLKRGVWVDLDDHDVRTLRRLAGGGQPQQQQQPGERDGGRGNSNNKNKRRNKRGRGPRPDATNVGAVENREVRDNREGRDNRETLSIPNPLQQTFDRRAIQQERQQRREIPEDGPIPNPLQQTYDKRALQRERQPQRDIPEDGPIPNPLQQTYDKRFTQKPRGFGSGGSGGSGAGGRGGRKGGGGGGGGERQPDPMQTSVGYIGGDAFLRKGRGGGGGGGGAGGGGGGRRGGRGR